MANVFDALASVTANKVQWKDLPEHIRNEWSSYIINRFLSMNFEMIDTVNELQLIASSTLQPREYHMILLDILPHKRLYFKYMKSNSSMKIDASVLDILSKHYQCSKRSVYSMIDVAIKVGYEEFVDVLKMYSIEEKLIAEFISTLRMARGDFNNTNERD